MIRPENWSPADGLTLEPNALLAAKELHDNLVLTAGPGAGKSEMLAQRADFLLKTGTCYYPKRILAISFKVDASKNLKERVMRRCGSNLSERFDSNTFHGFAKRIVDKFRPILVGENKLRPDYQIGLKRIPEEQITFDDLIPFAIEILKSSKIARNAIQQTYSDVFLDEFQDCTAKQYELIKLVFMKTKIRLIAVGDTKQRIMGWAGALEGIFQKFATDFNAHGLNLYLNFRSKPNLRRMQNEIIKVMDIAAAAKDEDIKGHEGIIEVLKFKNSVHESIHIVDQIEHWINVENIPNSEIAILTSKQLDIYAEHIMVELGKRGIPYRNEQNLQDISSEPVVRMILDFLSILYCTREPDSYTRLMNSLVDFELDEDSQIKLQNKWSGYFDLNRKQIHKQKTESNDADTIWQRVIEFLNTIGTERLTSLSTEYSHGSRLSDIVKEIKEKFIIQYNLEKNVIKTLKVLTLDNSVRLMSIHKSKGLEFDSVVLLGVEKETFWSEIEAERCAFFVAVSRAKRRLVITHSMKRTIPKSWNSNRTPHEEFIGYAKKFASEKLIDVES